MNKYLAILAAFVLVLSATGSGGHAVQQGTRTNGFTTLNTYSTSEASNSVSTSPASLTLSGGGDPPYPLCVIVTNTGSNDAWVSPYSGGHTWLCPAGSTTYVPTALATLYAMGNGGSTTLIATKAGY